MNAMVLCRTGDVSRHPLTMEDRPIPNPGPGQVLVKIHVCGVCRTDLHVVEGELSDSALPLIPGHEAVGTVARVPPAVTGLQIKSSGRNCLAPRHVRPVRLLLKRERGISASRPVSPALDEGYAVCGGAAPFAYPIPPVFPMRRRRRCCAPA